jgi:hypothetical protein
LTLVGAVGRILEDVDEDDVELLVELPDVVFPEGVAPITVVMTCEATTVVVCRPGPKPIEVERMVVVIVREPVSADEEPVSDEF